MNLIQFEIDICERNIKFEKNLLKICKLFILLLLSMIFVLSITAYYFDNANWLNGLALGMDIMNLIMFSYSRSIAKSNISYYELKLDLYKMIKNINKD